MTNEELRRSKAAIETLEITSNKKLFLQISKVSESIDEDTRLGKLHSFEEAFFED